MQTDGRLSCRGASWPLARVGASMAGEGGRPRVCLWKPGLFRAAEGAELPAPPQGTRQNAGVPLGPAGGGPQDVPAGGGRPGSPEETPEGAGNQPGKRTGIDPSPWPKDPFYSHPFWVEDASEVSSLLKCFAVDLKI